MSLPTIPEYSTAIKTPALVHPAILRGGHPVEKGCKMIRYSGGFCVVFPYQTSTRKYAVRCWHAEVADAKERTQIIAQALKDCQLPYFVGFEYHEDGIVTQQGIQPIVVMDWVEAKALKKFLSEHINDTSTINVVAENFKEMVADLHTHHLAHGDLQHGNIMVRPDNSLVLVDYDSMYTPALEGMKDDIKGLAGYQHEARWKNQFVTPKADYFSELVIYLSLKALAKYPQLWMDLHMEDTETMLFSAEDIASRGHADIFSRLKKDAELSPLVDKLCEFMDKKSIDELEPLEDALISNHKRLVEGIGGKWGKGNGNIGLPVPHGKIEDPKSITIKWARGNGYVRPSFPTGKIDDPNSIASKWKSEKTNVASEKQEKIANTSKAISAKFKTPE